MLREIIAISTIIYSLYVVFEDDEPEPTVTSSVYFFKNQNNTLLNQKSSNFNKNNNKNLNLIKINNSYFEKNINYSIDNVNLNINNSTLEKKNELNNTDILPNSNQSFNKSDNNTKLQTTVDRSLIIPDNHHQNQNKGHHFSSSKKKNNNIGSNSSIQLVCGILKHQKDGTKSLKNLNKRVTFNFDSLKRSNSY
ncbi:hypothetical protein HDU92_007926 [Lobulomyces angularis]|nr:hypothetical protein HDU92_007926 [Lobulomyces angularis]